MTTVKPVTTGGWYELADGRVALYTWRDGRLDQDSVVASWTDVPKPDYARDEREYRAAAAIDQNHV